MSHPNQGLEGLVKHYRDKAERLEKLLKWQGEIHVEKVACIHALDNENQRLQADLEQAQEKLAILQAEKAEIEEENENLQAELRSLYQFTGNLPWVKAEVGRMREHEAWVKEGKG